MQATLCLRDLSHMHSCSSITLDTALTHLTASGKKIYSHLHHLRLGLGLAQHRRPHPRHQEAQIRLPRQPGPTPHRRPHRRHRRLGLGALTICARFDGIPDGDLDRDRRRGGSVPFPRGCQVRLKFYLSLFLTGGPQPCPLPRRFLTRRDRNPSAGGAGEGLRAAEMSDGLGRG